VTQAPEMYAKYCKQGGICRGDGETRPGHWNSGSPPLEFSSVSHSQGGMVKIPLTGTGKLSSKHI